MFERFTPEAIKVIILAQEESRRLGHNFVGTEMLLLGLIAENKGFAGKSLRQSGLKHRDMRTAVERQIGRGNGKVAMEIPFTPSAKRSLEASWNFARSQHVNYISTEHLLVGLFSLDKKDMIFKVLSAMGVSPDRVRGELEKIMKLPHGAAEFTDEREEAEVLSPAQPQSQSQAQVQPHSQAQAQPQSQMQSQASVHCQWCGEKIIEEAKVCRFCNKPQGAHAKHCYSCAEVIWAEATVCRFCNNAQP
jgi:ATP-dependent Clp protease ATP-binding subunit ClpA